MRNLVMMATLLAASAGAQDDLARAIAVEEVEHDTAAAVELYRAVAEGPAAPGVKTSAWLRLGRALRVLGEDDAARRALARAAEGEGDAAARARAMLQDPQDPGELRAKIEDALGRLAKDNSAAEDLVWIGDPVVPYVLRALETPPSDRFAHGAAYVLLRVGGAAVNQWVDTVVAANESTLQQALLAAFDPASANAAVVERLRPLLTCSDAQVRESAVLKLSSAVPATDIIARAGDDSSRVRAVALKRIRTLWYRLRHLDGEVKSLEQLLPYLERGLENFDSKTGERVIEFLRMDFVFRTAAGRSLFLRALQRPGFPESSVPRFSAEGLAPDLHLGECLEVAREIGRVEYDEAQGRERASPRQRLLGNFVNCCLEGWRREALPGVFELIELGYDRVSALSSFVYRHANDDASRLHLARLVRKVSGPSDAGRFLLERTPPPDVAVPLIDWLRGYAAGSISSSDAAANALAKVLGKAGTEEAAGFLEQLARTRLYPLAAAGLAAGSSAAMVAATVRVMALENEADGVEVARNLLFRAALNAQVEGAEDQFAKAYELGIRPTFDVRGLEWVQHPYISFPPPATLAAILERCLALPMSEPWEDVTDAGVRGWPDEAITVLYARALNGHHPKLVKQLLYRTAAPGADEFFVRCLRSDEYVNFTLEALGQGARSSPAIHAVVKELVESGKLLESDRVDNCEAARALAVLDPVRAPKWILPLLDDPDSTVRAVVCQLAGQLLSRELVPGLLGALRDPDGNVRQAAAASLEAIEFCEQQTARWQKVGGASGLDDASAAEALIRRAKEGDRELRLLAIQSLGTLGTPETLPFLLDLIAGDDPEIAAAARTAVAEIHSAGRARGR